MDKKSYSLKESALAFIFVLIAVFATSILMINIVGVVSSSTGVDVNIVYKYEWITYLNMFLSAFLFFVVYLAMNFFKRKDFVVASKLKVKFDYKIFLGVILLAIIAVLSSVNATGLFNYIFSFTTSAQVTSSLGVTMNNFWQFLLVVLLIAVLPAICEELIFRGIIYNGLRQKFSAKVSIIISAILFTLIHLSIYKTFFQFILGIILGLLIYYTGTIFYGMVFHFFNNFFIIFTSYIFKGQPVFEFTTWGVKEILLTILFLAIGVAITFLFFKILKNYTNKHKNYFGLEKTDKPLGSILTAEEELQKINVNEEGLSDYDKKLVSTDTGITDKGWLAAGIICAIIIWSLNSFGGFL
ncbi:MAG: CPBP family intramembrane metalloprotease [Clostridia bacterium]|nr:CPBP family intramembrane metalloprotease [Clostridia bacterium]